jgi:hypothetical protein
MSMAALIHLKNHDVSLVTISRKLPIERYAVVGPNFAGLFLGGVFDAAADH